ncbi:TIGR03757 family integrating conjugative element protein [Salmonella enterica]|nr:TIGR03757 family integrating conjugative element protein [Salmonella enterica]EAX6601626.1 TIGR03757 family integrating conjugative element protein [Salmonella enterica]
MCLRRLFFLLAAISVTTRSLATTVIYTTLTLPVAVPPSDVLVYILEDVHSLEQSLFPALSENQQQAEKQARLRIQRADWHEQEARLTRAYQALLDARTVGIEKVPAVVIDDNYVIYGTTDVALAQQKLDDWREQQP